MALGGGLSAVRRQFEGKHAGNYISLADFFANKRERFIDPFHFKDEGNQEVAEYLYRVINTRVCSSCRKMVKPSVMVASRPGDVNGDEVGLGLDRAIETKAPRQL